ncbi:hypothetical protein B0H19DRAFT_1372979 [Mycena capillaripes]|nr:hypothetical protein B0H19DRAFT_1372979 [Mycena capillaripes]
MARRPAPVSEWGNCFQLAKESIEKHVDEHKRLLSRRNNPLADHVPRLVDLAAQRLADFSIEDADSLDGIPAVILDSYIWKWHKIGYPAFRRALLRLLSDPDVEMPMSTSSLTKDIDEWILLNERWLRDGNHAQWHNGLATLSDADRFEMLCEGREPLITIQRSVEAFQRTFEHMSDGLLKNLNWNNVFVAGGFVLGSLLSVDTLDGQPHKDPRWNSSDIDVYIHGLSPREANEKVKHLFDTFSANLPRGTQKLVVRNCTTITFYARYPLRRIQIVLKLVESPKTVLLNFDLDMCAMGWDGTMLWMLPRAARALETGCSVFTMDLVYGHYLSNRRASTQERIFKYANKGYGIRILPSYISSLATRKSSRDNPRYRFRRPETLDLVSIAAEERDRITEAVDRMMSADSEYMHTAFETLMPRGYRASRCLNGFHTFVSCATLWAMAHRGIISLQDSFWAYNGYEDAMTTYDEAPRAPYKWDDTFNVAEFQHHIDEFNSGEIWDWAETDLNMRLIQHGVTIDEWTELEAYKRMVLLPCDFAVYANDVVSQAQAQAGLPETKLLMPAVHGFNFLGNPDPRTDGLFLWRIGKDLMWQQPDRRVDEVFEILYAFRRVNEQLRDPSTFQVPRFRKELARREVYDEFDVFARWVQA